jgi:hypothetical protein
MEEISLFEDEEYPFWLSSLLHATTIVILAFI